MSPLQESRKLRNICRHPKRQQEQPQDTKSSSGNNNTGPITQDSTRFLITLNKTTVEKELSTHPLRHVEKLSILQKNAILNPMWQIDRVPGTKDRQCRAMLNNRTPKTMKVTVSKLLPNL